MLGKRLVHFGTGLEEATVFGADCRDPGSRRRYVRGAIVAAVIVDAESVRGKEWPVVKSLKLVRPSLPIILLDERSGIRNLELPEGVDELVSVASLEKLPEAINQLLRSIARLPPP